MPNENVREVKDSAASKDYAVILPCKPEDFREFVANLLGKPQTITRYFDGPFDLSKSDLENFHHLLVQRVQQQNDGTLIQFSITIVYNDDSSVLLNSFEDFLSYTEVRSIASIAAHLSWIFLVRFQDRNVPEKQQIDVSAIAEPSGHSFRHLISGDHILLRSALKGVINFRIAHTARTWGSDIEALLTGHIEGLIKPTHPVKKFLKKQSGWIGFSIGTLLFLTSLASTFYSTQLFLHRQTDAVSKVLTKTDYLVQIVAEGVWPRFFFYVFCFIVLAFVASVFLGIWSGSSADNDPPSFVLLSKQAERLRLEEINKYKKGWRMFVISLLSGVIIGVLGNAVFALILRNWIW